MSTHSRRAILAGIAAMPALAAPALALSGPDPIFAAIETHRATWADLSARCSALDAADTPEAEAELSRIMAVDNEAAGELADAKPVTLAGAIALLRHSVEFSEEYAFEDDEDDKMKPLSYFIERNVADALERMGAVS